MPKATFPRGLSQWVPELRLKLHRTGSRARAAFTVLFCSLSSGHFCMKAEIKRQSVALFNLRWECVGQATQIFHNFPFFLPICPWMTAKASQVFILDYKKFKWVDEFSINNENHSYKMMPSTSSFTIFPIWMPSFLCLIVLAKTSTTMSNRGGQSWCLDPHIWGNVFNLPPLKMMLVVGYS